MNCPICNLDLSPLDLVSRTEHVDMCIENGPGSVIEIGESGKLVIKKSVPASKQRKICPICDKTFQNLTTHFKTCAIKNDVPPSLMIDYWDNSINADSKNPRKFPRELLDSFVARSVKEGRAGEQVDFARALSLSMADDNGEDVTASVHETSNQAEEQSAITTSRGLDANQLLMGHSNGRPAAAATRAAPTKQTSRPQRYKLELVDETTKKANVALRIDRELAATRSKRYLEALLAQQRLQPVHCSQIDPPETIIEIVDDDDSFDKIDDRNCDKLFYRARLKACLTTCPLGLCQEHELILFVEGFSKYSGPTIDAIPSKSVKFGDNDKEIDNDQEATISPENGS